MPSTNLLFWPLLLTALGWFGAVALGWAASGLPGAASFLVAVAALSVLEISLSFDNASSTPASSKG